MAYTHTYTHTYSYTYTKTHTSYVYTYTYNTLHDTHRHEYAHRHAHTLPIHIHTYTHMYIYIERYVQHIEKEHTLMAIVPMVDGYTGALGHAAIPSLALASVALSRSRRRHGRAASMPQTWRHIGGFKDVSR